MKKRKKKTKINYFLLLVSDSPTKKVKKFKYTKARINFVKTVAALFFIALLGYIAYNSYQNTVIMSREDAFKAKIKELEDANAVLMQEKEELTEKVTILSKTVNEKVDAEKVLEEKNLPKGFPLSGKAAMEETQETIEGEDGDEVRPMLLFDADEEVSVVATGGGIVCHREMDNEYGYQVHIDHGNGYITIYRSGTVPKVDEGDEITRGTLLFEMKEDDDNELADNMAYQVTKDGEYIVPTEVLEING